MKRVKRLGSCLFALIMTLYNPYLNSYSKYKSLFRSDMEEGQIKKMFDDLRSLRTMATLRWKKETRIDKARRYEKIFIENFNRISKMLTEIRKQYEEDMNYATLSEPVNRIVDQRFCLLSQEIGLKYSALNAYLA